MVVNSNILNGLTTFLESLRQGLEVARTQLAEAESKVIRLESQTQSVYDAIAAYREYYDIPLPVLPLDAVDSDTTLTSRRHTFLLDSARRNGGILKRLDVREPMIQAGPFRDYEQFRQQISRILDEMECWERIKGHRGAYLLISANGHNGVDSQDDSRFTPNSIGVPIKINTLASHN